MPPSATGGTLYLPQIIEKVETAGASRCRVSPRACAAHVPLQPSTLALVRPACAAWSTRTRAPLRGPRRRHLGFRQDGHRPGEPPPQEGQDHLARGHSWFAAYAPSENPEIAVVVLIRARRARGEGGRAGRRRDHRRLLPLCGARPSPEQPAQRGADRRVEPAIESARRQAAPPLRLAFFGAIILLSILGVMNLHSATASTRMALGRQQIYWLAIGMACS